MIGANLELLRAFSSVRHVQFDEERLEGFDAGAGGHSETVGLRHADGPALPRGHGVRQL